ncbi:MAG: 3-dehydroquinate synthase [Alphaproteobacteria bacterium]|nr:3-dehydroquinate synthase [Alphaproteobacteria bacterium]
MAAVASQSLRVSLDGTRDYDILIERGCLARAGALLKDRFGERRIFIVRDAQVDAHAKALESALSAAGYSFQSITLPEGEDAKSWPVLQQTVNAMLEARLDRKSLVVALGGGVAGDHGGFAAAITLRGLDYVQVPTTLLSQVDSSVGGKTGINAPQGKNLVGAFHQPVLVLIDNTTLDTLPDRHMRAGYAEIVKYAFIRDAGFFEWLEANGAKVMARDDGALAHAVATSCAAKAAVVAADEREGGVRALLNFGHTFAHALEATCNYDRRLLHGEAVAIGMALAFDTSVRMGLCTAADAARATAHMQRLGMPTRIADIKDFPATTPDALVGLMGHDKKAIGGKLTFILSRGIGHAFVSREADIALVKEALAASMRT